jgi:hypothetical protein
MLVDAIPPIRHGIGRPRRRPLKLRGDKAYDSEQIRRELRRRGIKPLLNRRRKPRRHRKLWREDAGMDQPVQKAKGVV